MKPLMAMLPSLLVALFFPIALNYLDTLSLLTADFETNFPHWPPLYSLLIKLVLVLFGLSNKGIYVLIFVQLLLFSGSLFYFLWCFNNRSKRLIATFLVAGNVGILVVNNGIYPESAFVSFLLFNITSITRIVFAGGARQTAALFGFGA